METHSRRRFISYRGDLAVAALVEDGRSGGARVAPVVA